MASCVFIYAHKRSMLASFDYIMVMLILLQPSFPVHMGFAQSVGNAVSVVMGPAIALLAYRFIFPAHPSKRLQHLLTMVRYETRSLCAPHLQADQVLAKRTRLIHSLLRAQRLNDKHAQSNPDIAADILKQLAKIELIVGLQQSLQDHAQVSSSTRRLMRAVLKTWQNPRTRCPASHTHAASLAPTPAHIHLITPHAQYRPIASAHKQAACNRFTGRLLTDKHASYGLICSFIISRILNFCTLPLPVIGNSVTNLM